MTVDPNEGWRTGAVDILRPLGWTYDGSSDYSIGYADDPQANCVARMWDRKDERARAYCDLFTAAPDLLAALKSLLAECGGCDDARIAAKAAIEKAEGRKRE